MDVRFNRSNPITSTMPQRQNAAEDSQNTGKVKPNESNREIADEYIPGREQKNVSYTNHTKRYNAQLIARLKQESEEAHNQLRELVRKLLERQGLTYRDALNPKTQIAVDDTARLEAKEAIGAGGLLSPEKVSDRIVDFAIALSGGDKNKIAAIREAIDKGFREAAKALGGTLPKISNKTYDLIMEKLDGWVNEE